MVESRLRGGEREHWGCCQRRQYPHFRTHPTVALYRKMGLKKPAVTGMAGRNPARFCLCHKEPEPLPDVRDADMAIGVASRQEKFENLPGRQQIGTWLCFSVASRRKGLTSSREVIDWGPCLIVLCNQGPRDPPCRSWVPPFVEGRPEQGSADKKLTSMRRGSPAVEH